MKLIVQSLQQAIVNIKSGLIKLNILWSKGKLYIPDHYHSPENPATLKQQL